MSDQTDKPKLGTRPPLGIKRTVETGKVKQSFSHGRSNTVVVEVKKRRILGRPGEAPAAAPEPEAAAPAPAPAPVAAPPLLRLLRAVRAADDIAARKEDTARRMREAEEARMTALEDARRREEQAKVNATEDDKKRAEDKRKADEDAARQAEEDAKRRIEEEARKADEADAAAAEAAADRGGPGSRSPSPKRPLQRPLRAPSSRAPARCSSRCAARRRPRPSPSRSSRPRKRRAAAVRASSSSSGGSSGGGNASPARRPEPARPARPGQRGGDDRRHSGKLTVTRALAGDDDRSRSLAALRRAREKEKRAYSQSGPREKQVRDVVVPDSITVGELANRMAEKAADLVKALFKMGTPVTVNQSIDQDTAELLVTEFGHNIKRVSDSDVDIDTAADVDAETTLVAASAGGDHHGPRRPRQDLAARRPARRQASCRAKPAASPSISAPIR